MRRLLILGWLLVAVPACEPLPPTAVGTSDRPSDALIAFYDQLAFEIGTPDNTGPYPRVQRWPDATSISVEMTGGTTADRAEANQVFADIEALTDLTFRWAEADSNSIVILFAPHEDWWCDPTATSAGLHCPLLVQEPPFPTKGALIYILPDLDGVHRRCILRHELMHALGFRGHTDRASSALRASDCSVTAFSDDDEFAIETHYDPRVQSYMHRDSVHAALGWD